MVIPAHPLALTAARALDERRQRALTRYYLAAGAGGLAVGVHTTQFAIRSRGLLRPVLALAAEETARAGDPATVRVAGVCGPTPQATAEARLAAELGYHAGLVSLADLPSAPIPALLDHVRAVGEILPVFGFYLQPAVGGRELPTEFWRRFAELDAVVAIKVAPFDRYRTLDVLRAVAGSGRADDIALYTGNDDHILLDLLTSWRAEPDRPPVRLVGGLLGQWAVWTRRAVELHRHCRAVALAGGPVPERLLTLAAQLTDANGAIFDAPHRFAGCIPGIHAVLAAQGLLAGTWCLDPLETLSSGQEAEIRRVIRAYPHLTDDDFVAEHRDEWLAI
ncbi:MAG TPA: dihydrodipicolinate synthase family protein [Gemmatimonadales bacterium]|nr:dihydrodipicolinate synthase family protein [Gemmatimonadales bacterium]